MISRKRRRRGRCPCHPDPAAAGARKELLSEDGFDFLLCSTFLAIISVPFQQRNWLLCTRTKILRESSFWRLRQEFSQLSILNPSSTTTTSEQLCAAPTTSSDRSNNDGVLYHHRNRPPLIEWGMCSSSSSA